MGHTTPRSLVVTSRKSDSFMASPPGTVLFTTCVIRASSVASTVSSSATHTSENAPQRTSQST
eukprot:5723959-Lingulodinium_polyedra.AAC.1